MQTRDDLTRLLWVVGNENWTDPKGDHRSVATATYELARLLYRATDLVFRGNRGQPIHRCNEDLLIVNSPVHLRVIRKVYGTLECEPVYASLSLFSRLRILGSAARMAVRASVLANGRVSPASLIRVATKAIETLTLLAKLKVVGQSDRPNRIVGFEFGYVALAALWFKHESKTTTAFIQHGFLNRFQTPIAFDKFYLNLEWDRKWIESHLGAHFEVEYLYSAKPRSVNPALSEKRILWCLEYPWRLLSGEEMLQQMSRFFDSLIEADWKIVLRAHPFDCLNGDIGKWYLKLLRHGEVELDAHKDLSIERSIVSNRCIAVGTFSSASIVEALYSGVLPVMLDHPVREFIVGDMDRLCLCLNSQNDLALSEFASKEPAEIARLAQLKRTEVFGQHENLTEPLDAPHPS